MMGDLFYGGLRSGSMTRTAFLGFQMGTAAELIPIDLNSAAPRASFTSVGISQPFISITPVTGLTNQSVIALQRNNTFLQAVQGSVPGATFVGSQAIPQGLVGQVPGLQNLVPGNPAQFTPVPVGVLITQGGRQQLMGGFPGSTPGQNLTLPGGGPINNNDLYIILNTVATAGGMALSLPEPGGFSRYTRISQNTSPIPMDRVFTNYNYLNSVLNGTGTSQFMVGFERTFLDGNASVQVNIPLSSTLSSTQRLDNGASATDAELGNISVWFKYLAYKSDNLALSAGLGVNTPTADDVVVYSTLNSTTPLLRVRNESVMLNPFVGAVYRASDCFFVQNFTQVDIDTNGNPVAVGGSNIGRLRSATLFSTGFGAGYVVYQNDDSCSMISRIVPMTEIHYTSDLGTGSTFTSAAGTVTSRTNNIDVLNLTAGTNISFGPNANLNVGVGVPVSGNTDRQYNWQCFAQLNILFGGR